ncbi:MAG: c-type cytochrome [Gammaproteobacteria bacterium]|nr:c-type cytochrome [Gammaproteobacteria bacterium]NIT63123.1 c-type cytochrome [Gammaproteobacteria bacterium]NIW35932.1 c-type cytochrome [Gemmatimonadota bacterium]NIX10185.1 c-type cytochrome [Gammaproteobacteria bacterium]NIY31703.1 c-type cytochrome [Gammaproteobacteria bacterium]
MRAASAWTVRVGLVAGALALAAPAGAQSGDAERGEEIYARRCVGCHGVDGDGLGPAAERLNPPPRDFTFGLYKFRTTGFDDFVPNDSDLLRMIRDGMPGTAMPGWGDVLSEQDMRDLIAYIKTFAGLEEEEPGTQIDYASRVASSEDSIKKGRELFKDRCAECHGETGKGVATKKLKGDLGERTWPRNLTKPWSFRASNDPRDIFARISVGIPGTQMPSFADPKSKKRLSIEERWHVANYVASLAKTREVVRPEKTVVRVEKVDGELPAAPDEPRWDEIEPVTFLLVPQLIAKQRFFTPSNDTITVRGLYSDEEIALLLEWDDRTRSIPGDEKAEAIAEADMGEDAVAVQLPVDIPEGMEKPYFGMGDAANPVNVWHWKGGTTEQPQSVGLMNARGFEEIARRDAAAVGVRAKGLYRDGTWRVVMVRPLQTEDPEADIQFVEGRFTPIAFAAWDGSNSEAGSRHTMTTWYWLLLEPAEGARPYLAGLIAFVMLLGGELWWLRGATRKRAGQRP